MQLLRVPSWRVFLKKVVQFPERLRHLSLQFDLRTRSFACRRLRIAGLETIWNHFGAPVTCPDRYAQTPGKLDAPRAIWLHNLLNNIPSEIAIDFL
jgi:hypothetical protein